MILHGIKAHNFMSLRDCTKKELDGHLNLLKGANGCGKTTVFRAFKVIRDIFDQGKTIPFNLLCTRRVLPQEIDLTIDVEFNTSRELFFQAEVGIRSLTVTGVLCSSD